MNFFLDTIDYASEWLISLFTFVEHAEFWVKT